MMSKNVTNYSGHEETNESKHSIITVRKIEDLCMTPKKMIKLENLENSKNVQIENINSPQNFSFSNLDINLMELTQETQCKKESLYFCNIDTPNKKMKRNLSSDIEDYDQLPDMLKTELYNDELNDMEANDMLHDVSSMMDFEESKVSTDIFCSTMINPIQEDNITELSKDAVVDPLFIDDNSNVENTENQEIKYEDTILSSNIQEKKYFTNKTNVANNTKRNKKYKSNKEDANVDYDHIKYILGELDIELTSDEEEILDKEEISVKEETSNEVPKNIIKALYNLNVKLMHKVPLQHRIEHTAGSRTLTKKEKKLFLAYGPMKRGTFTPNEDTIIRNNWQAFCEAHNLNPKYVTLFINMKNNNTFYIRSLEQRRKFVQFLANGLPWRTLYSVYYRFKYLYGNHKKRFQRYTSSEDQNILSYMKGKQNIAKNNKRFIELSKILGRSKHSIWLRYQLLKKKLENEKPSTEIKWTLSSIGKFIETFMSVTLCETVEDLKDAIIPKPVWQKLEEKLHVDYNILRMFWIYQLHMQLFCPEPIHLNDIKIKLIEYIYGKGISHIREIVWSDVAKYFDGITGVFLCKTFCYLVQEVTKKIGTNHFPDIAEYLYNEKIQNIKNELTDKFLPRLSYNNGEIKIIDKYLYEDISI